MKLIIKVFGTGLLVLVLIYYAIGYFSSYIGWNGYEKWKDRKASQSISESIKRGVFVKKLNFKFEDYQGPAFKFEAFIEKGYRWGYDSSEQTVPLSDSKFPYQLSFKYNPINEAGLRIREDQLKKFDSSNSTRGYLRRPELPDTIILKILGDSLNSGVVKVW